VVAAGKNPGVEEDRNQTSDAGTAESDMDVFFPVAGDSIRLRLATAQSEKLDPILALIGEFQLNATVGEFGIKVRHEGVWTGRNDPRYTSSDVRRHRPAEMPPNQRGYFNSEHSGSRSRVLYSRRLFYKKKPGCHTHTRSHIYPYTTL
jgi:hypothetical protein